MAKLTISLDAQTAARLRKAARSAGVSQSRWLADLVRQRTATQWPESVRRLAGTLSDAPCPGVGHVVPENQLWTLREPDRSRIARGLAWASETEAKELDPDALLRRAGKSQRRQRGRRK
jgi:hypothetical protein